MATVGQIERKTQNRIVALFRDTLKYSYVGNWEDRLDKLEIHRGYSPLHTPSMPLCRLQE